MQRYRYKKLMADDEIVCASLEKHPEGELVWYEDVKHLEESNPVGDYTVTVTADTSQVEKELDRLIRKAEELDNMLGRIGDKLRR